MIADRLVEAGFEAVGMDHFARPWDKLRRAARAGRLHRNFQGYTDDTSRVLLGFGASSISRFTEGYAQNYTDIEAWRRAVEADALPSVRGWRFSDEDRLRVAFIERLMCNTRVDLAAIAPGRDFAEELTRLHALAAEGLVTLGQDGIEVTKLGRPFVRTVAAVFDAFRQAEPLRFSMAV